MKITVCEAGKSGYEGVMRAYIQRMMHRKAASN